MIFGRDHVSYDDSDHCHDEIFVAFIATPTKELSILCNLYLTILGKKESATSIVSGFL
jgi:hypothetical protein